jgi:glutamate dehydrogenase (NAD(P)+)
MSTRDPFYAADNLGPHKIVHVHEPRSGLQGTLVIDNIAIGPAIGGMRMAPDVSTDECRRLARAMTLKNASAGLRHGGAKSVLYGDPRMDPARKERLIRGFAAALRNESSYIFGPDMGTDETCMAWVKDEIGRACGLPKALGGIPLDELGATGWGLRHCAQVAGEFCGVDIDGARIAVQGFGAVGIHAARFLGELGAMLVAVADSRGCVADADGLDIDELVALKRGGGSVVDLASGTKGESGDIVETECDIWIPAARPDVIDEGNVDRLSARMVLQGAKRGVLCVPDFIANAGGVICAACEYAGLTRSVAFDAIASKIRDNTREILTSARERGLLPREAAIELAREKVLVAMATRRWAVF